ncbi:Uncharacterised protein [Mycobacteroides abscessus subsp. massiliense]|nr:Uncharacterised protein [Mycobacteroides abscessus subsp. massiliense]
MSQPTRANKVTEEQALAYCELMSLEPTAQQVQALQTATPQDLLTRAGRKHLGPEPPAPPSDAARERFSRAFSGAEHTTVMDPRGAKEYAAHCRELGYTTEQSTLMMIGFVAGWDAAAAAGIERIMAAVRDV